MGNPIQESKLALRRGTRQKLQAMSPGQQAAASARACALLQSQTLWQQAQSVLFFAPLPGEPDVWPLLESALAAGKTAALPRFDAADACYQACRIDQPAADLCTGRFGIREPAPHCAERQLKRLDLILVPGVAFDLRGRRLGRGRGFYDQLLAAVSGKTCGVAFDEQIVAAVPVEPHDIHLNCILTPTRWLVL
jgi:5-formyltetrahydrofolate cyclo-ligase